MKKNDLLFSSLRAVSVFVAGLTGVYADEATAETAAAAETETEEAVDESEEELPEDDGVIANLDDEMGEYEEPDWSKYELADMSGYEFFEPYEKDFVFYDMTIKDVLAEMEAGRHFILYFSSRKCPWCKGTTPVLNDAALEAGTAVAYVDTRKDPSWESNLDVTDYDLFAEAFVDWLDEDEEGRPHLYTPHVFFIADGEAVMDQYGNVASYQDPDIPMTEEEIKELGDIYAERIAAILY